MCNSWIENETSLWFHLQSTSHTETIDEIAKDFRENLPNGEKPKGVNPYFLDPILSELEEPEEYKGKGIRVWREHSDQLYFCVYCGLSDPMKTFEEVDQHLSSFRHRRTVIKSEQDWRLTSSGGGL